MIKLDCQAGASKIVSNIIIMMLTQRFKGKSYSICTSFQTLTQKIQTLLHKPYVHITALHFITETHFVLERKQLIVTHDHYFKTPRAGPKQ